MFVLKAMRYIWIVAFIHAAYIGYWHCHQCAVPFAPVQTTAHSAESGSVNTSKITSPQCSPCVSDCAFSSIAGQAGGEQGTSVVPQACHIHQSIVLAEPTGVQTGVDACLPHSPSLLSGAHGRRAPPFLV